MFKKLGIPPVRLGQTIFPKLGHEKERLGLRLDLGGTVSLGNGEAGNRFHIRPSGEATNHIVGKLISAKPVHFNIMSFDIRQGCWRARIQGDCP